MVAAGIHLDQVEVVRRPEGAGVAHDQEHRAVGQGIADRLDRLRAVFRADAHVPGDHPLAGIAGLAEQGPDHVAQARPGEGDGAGAARPADGEVEVAAEPPIGGDDAAILVQHHARRGVALHHAADGDGLVGDGGTATPLLALPARDLAAPGIAGQVDWVFRGAGRALEQPGVRVDGREELLEPADALGGAEEQVSPRAHGIVEQRHHRLLQAVVEIDQEVAAGEEIHPGEGRVLHEAVAGEADQVADLGRDGEALGMGQDVAFPQGGGDVRQRRGRVGRLPGDLEHALVDVGGEDLHRRRHVHPPGGVGEQHGDAVGLLAARTARNPDADILVRVAGAQERLDGPLPEHLEHLRVAEEPGDVDEEVPEQGLALVSVRPDPG